MGRGLVLKKDVAEQGRISTETGKSKVEKTGPCLLLAGQPAEIYII
jgi:hypothetical protein